MSRELEAYELAILRRPPDAPSYDEEALDRLMGQHLAHLDALRAEGVLVVHGPVLDQPDESVRGVNILRAGSVDEARRLCEQDPMFAAGRLVFEVMTYWCAPGSITRPGRPFTLR